MRKGRIVLLSSIYIFLFTFFSILGSSYISISDHLALIVPNNSTSILVNLKIDLKKVEHPAKKELGSLLERKKMLEVL